MFDVSMDGVHVGLTFLFPLIERTEKNRIERSFIDPNVERSQIRLFVSGEINDLKLNSRLNLCSSQFDRFLGIIDASQMNETSP